MIKIEILVALIVATAPMLNKQTSHAQPVSIGSPMATAAEGARDARHMAADAPLIAQGEIKEGAAFTKSASGSVPLQHPHAHGSATQFEIPESMKIEHEELHAELAHLTLAGGRTGEAAKAVAEVLDKHFAKEEKYALPPLGLLVPLSQGKFETDMAGVLKMTDKLEAEMPAMLSEHKEIVAALKKLIDVGKAENKPEGVHFAENLMAHARVEEEITYPTALLVGRYVKCKLAK